MTNDYLETIKKLFEYYKVLGEKTFDQLNEKELFCNIMERVTALVLS